MQLGADVHRWQKTIIESAIEGLGHTKVCSFPPVFMRNKFADDCLSLSVLAEHCTGCSKHRPPRDRSMLHHRRRDFESSKAAPAQELAHSATALFSI